VGLGGWGEEGVLLTKHRPFLSQRKGKVDIKKRLFCVVTLTTVKQSVV